MLVMVLVLFGDTSRPDADIEGESLSILLWLMLPSLLRLMMVDNWWCCGVLDLQAKQQAEVARAQSTLADFEAKQAMQAVLLQRWRSLQGVVAGESGCTAADGRGTGRDST